MGLFESGANILVDVGGSGVKFAEYRDGKIGSVRKYSIDSKEGLFQEIRRIAGTRKISKIAFSVAGFVNAEKGIVLRSANAPFLEGDFAADVKKAFPGAKVSVVNDGEAHTRALLVQKDIRFGAIHLALGTAVAFGMIDAHGNIVRTAKGENWDIGDMQMRTRSEHKDVWYLLGSMGLQELEQDMGADAYMHFGCRLGTLLSQLAVIFRPCTIGLSGGIVDAHADAIERGMRTEFREPACYSQKIEFRLLTNMDTAMQGLTTLL